MRCPMGLFEMCLNSYNYQDFELKDIKFPSFTLRHCFNGSRLTVIAEINEMESYQYQSINFCFIKSACEKY